jgi:hypothetical protein
MGHICNEDVWMAMLERMRREGTTVMECVCFLAGKDALKDAKELTNIRRCIAMLNKPDSMILDIFAYCVVHHDGLSSQPGNI